MELCGTFSAPAGDPNNIIKTPCGGPLTVTEANKKRSKETISQLYKLVNEAQPLAEMSKFEMTKAIANSKMIISLDNNTFVNTINAGLDIQQGLGKLFKSNFGNFSELAIYSDLTGSAAAANHVVNIKAVLNKLWTILCELQIGTLSQGESITEYLNTFIISDQVLLFTSPEEILFRNYIIMRDVYKNLEQFSLLYKHIKDGL